MKKIHIVIIITIIAVATAVFLLRPKNQGSTGNPNKTATTAATADPNPVAPPSGNGQFVPPVDMAKLVPPGEFAPLKPLDPKNYKDLTPEVKDIFDKPGMDLLAERRLSGTNPYKMLQEMRLKEGDTLADIGCGTGFYTFIFAWKTGKKTKSGGMTIVEPFPDGRGMIYAIDINKAMLKYNEYMLEHLKSERKIEFRNIVFICNEADGGIKGVPDNSLDFAYLSETHAYNHIWGNTSHLVNDDLKKNKEAFFKAIEKQTSNLTKTVHKALKKDGIYIITENDIRDKPTESILYKEDVIKLLESDGMFKIQRVGSFFRDAYILFFKKV
jgi:SAM-dependent methyltransferase